MPKFGGVKDWSKGYMKKRLMGPPAPNEAAEEAAEGEMDSAAEESAERVDDGGMMGQSPAPEMGPPGGEGMGAGEMDDGMMPMRLSPEEVAMIEEMRAKKMGDESPGMDMEGIDMGALSDAVGSE